MKVRFPEYEFFIYRKYNESESDFVKRMSPIWEKDRDFTFYVAIYTLNHVLSGAVEPCKLDKYGLVTTYEDVFSYLLLAVEDTPAEQFSEAILSFISRPFFSEEELVKLVHDIDDLLYPKIEIVTFN